MAVALTTGWQTVATATSSYEYGGLNYYLTVELQAYYQDIDANRATVRLREKLSAKLKRLLNFHILSKFKKTPMMLSLKRALPKF